MILRCKYPWNLCGRIWQTRHLQTQPQSSASTSSSSSEQPKRLCKIPGGIQREKKTPTQWLVVLLRLGRFLWPGGHRIPNFGRTATSLGKYYDHGNGGFCGVCWTSELPGSAQADWLRNYTSIHVLPQSMAISDRISDRDWTPLVAKENELLSAMIKTNEWQQAHQVKERVVERIACEMRGHGTGIILQRQIYDELLSEFYELRRGREARFPRVRSRRMWRVSCLKKLSWSSTTASYIEARPLLRSRGENDIVEI
jgi:hypothetical protein